MPEGPLSRVVVVLDHPQDVVNIAAVTRVVMNFGLSGLRLVSPDDFDPHRIQGIAHRSGPLVEATTLHDTLEEALAACTWVLGTTARPRTAGRNYVRPRPAALDVVRKASDGEVAIVLGREDRGLSNEALDLCHAVAIIPTSNYSSLNLAQACLVLAYEVFLAAEDAPVALPRGRRATRPPTEAELELTYRALRRGLETIDFFKARKPEAVMRTLRTLIARSEPDLREAKLLAAVGFEIGHFIDRLRIAGPPVEGGADPGRDIGEQSE